MCIYKGLLSAIDVELVYVQLKLLAPARGARLELESYCAPVPHVQLHNYVDALPVLELLRIFMPVAGNAHMCI